MTGIGLIGSGAIGEMHAKALRELGAPLVAVAGTQPDDLQDFCARNGIAAMYSTHELLLEDDRVDAVIVATPSATHVGITSDALASGRPVLCEVPLALSHADASAVVATAADAGLPLGVAHTLRYWEPHRMLARELAELSTPVLHVVVRSFLHRQTDVGWTGKKRDWTDSVVWHHGSHAVDAALWFLGAAEVEWRGSFGPAWRNGQTMDAAFALRTNLGGIGSVDLSYHSRRAGADFLVIAEEHTWEITGGSLYRDDELLFEGDVASVQADAIRSQDSAFLRAVAGDADGFYTGAAALPALRILDDHGGDRVKAQNAGPQTE